jgi:hypothetical protein
MTDMTDDQADAAPQSDSHRPADEYALLERLALVFSDHRLFRARLKELRSAETTAKAAQAQLEADRATFERLQSTSLAEIAEQRKSAVSIWTRATRMEQDIAAREQRCIEREEAAGLTGALMPTPVGPAGGLTQAPDAAAVMAARDRLRRMGPDGQPFPASTTITRELGPGELEGALISRQRRQRGVRVHEF